MVKSRCVSVAEADRILWNKFLWRVTFACFGAPSNDDVFGMKESEAQVRRYRGSRFKSILRIRIRYRMWPWAVSLEEMFLHAYRYHEGAWNAKAKARRAYEDYLASRQLPIFFVRAGDPHVFYTCFAKPNLRRGLR
jgi:hypothetical protein